MKWPTFLLGDLCSVITKGTTPRTLGKEYVSDGIPFLRAENLLGEEVALGPGTLFIDEETNKILARSIVKANDVLISIAGTIGRCAIVPHNLPLMNCNQAVAIVRIAGPLYRRFLLYWLKTQDAQWQMAGAKVTQTISNLSLSQIRKLRVPIPPLAEQHRLVEVLDQANTLRRKRAEADAKAARILPALFYKIFGDPATNPRGWEMVLLEDVLADTRNGLYKHGDFYGRGTQILKMFNIQSGELELSRLDRVELTGDEAEKYALNPGDILINRVNTKELVGKCAVITSNLGPAVFESKNIRARLKPDRATPEFVAHYLNTTFGHAALCQGVKHAIGMATINNTDLRKMAIPRPPLELQKNWDGLVCQVRESKKSRRKACVQLDQLFDVFLYRAFAGDLTAKWRKVHMKELLEEMETQAKALEPTNQTKNTKEKNQ